MTLSQVFSYTALVHAIAGTAGGSTAMSIFYPLDNIRTFLQVDTSEKSQYELISNLIKDEGVSVLYRGLGPVLISLGFSNFVYFYSNNMLKAIYRKVSEEKEIPIVVNLFIASIAGCINVFTTCPLWVANTRLKVQKEKKVKEKKI
jgi:adenine nucleotide transporter 17